MLIKRNVKQGQTHKLHISCLQEIDLFYLSKINKIMQLIIHIEFI